MVPAREFRAPDGDTSVAACNRPRGSGPWSVNTQHNAEAYLPASGWPDMAQRGREGMGKRARERARQERQEAKRLRREAAAEDSGSAVLVDTAALMEEYRRLSEQHEAKAVSEPFYQQERRRIFAELGIETDEDD